MSTFIVIVLLIVILPLAIRNQTSFRKAQIEKRAARFGVELDFGK